MKNTRLLLSLLLFLAFQNVGFTQKKLAADIQAYIKPLVNTNNFSGVILIHQKGKELYTGAFGLANRSFNIPNETDTKFQIASVSKPFTSVAILLLEEEGRLSTEDPLSKFIPDYPRGDELNIHHLLTHTSGIPNINRFDQYDTLSCFPQAPASLLLHFKFLPLEFEPGEKYSYSNSNYNLLAYIIEKASGRTYGDFVRERIFRLLKMENTNHPDNALTVVLNKAVGYSPVGTTGLQLSPYLNWTVKTGNGSLYSTAGDLYRFSHHLFKGKLLKEPTRAKLLTEHMPNVGYGWFIRPRHEKKQYHINGRSPGFSSLLSYYPEEDLTIIVLSNNYSPLATSIGIDLAAMIFDQPYELLLAESSADADLDQFVGDFQFGENFYVPNIRLEVRKGVDGLSNQWGGLLPKGKNEFIQRMYWSTVLFEADESGKVTKMIFDGFEGRRVGD